MRSSVSSSATGTNPSPGDSPPPPARKVFALTGRSRPLDPRTNAVRPDIADIRLAEYVFAPHYAAPLARRVTADASLLAGRGPEAEVIASLRAGDAFDLLDVTGGLAWGVAEAHGLVGYLDADLLEPVA